ncbi:MAG TPA: hypothetical protein VIM24_11140, partial [Candidatus Limnocylindrales bacterium]
MTAARAVRTIAILAVAMSAMACSGAVARPSVVPASTAKPSGSATANDPVVAAAGDIACDPTANTGAPARCDDASTAAQILALKPPAVLALGDDQYENNT